MKVDDAEEFTQSLGQIVAGSWRQVALAERLGVPEALGMSTGEWVEQRLGGYVRMSIPERRQAVTELTGEGHSQRQVADVLGVGKTTVVRDLNPAGPNGPSDETDVTFDQVDELPEQVPGPNGTPEPVDAIGALAVGQIREIEARKLAARGREPQPVAQPVPPPDGKYRCLVVDPPWPMRKIERDERPDQGATLDYPVMTLDQMADERWVPVRTLADDDCHLYLWVTHSYLPAGLDLVEQWGFRYQCLLTWRKNVGMTPFSWMYDTEHVIFARRGGLDLARLGLRLSFDAPVEGHSVKPDVFYQRVIAASPGPRVDMFARRPRHGFTAWGDQVNTDA